MAAFGVKGFDVTCQRSMLLEKQVAVLSHASDDEFVLRLNSTSTNDELILAKIPPKKTLAETVADAQRRIEQDGVKKYQKTFRPVDSLIVPVVSLNVQRSYTELIDRHLKNKGCSTLYVGEANQGIRSRLDETGASLSSEAEFELECAPPKPRQFVFDRPFLLYLKQKDSEVPYFAIWIETAEVLERLPKKP